MAQGIKEILDSREREVRRSIDDLRLKQLAPLERELAEIAAARKAITNLGGDVAPPPSSDVDASLMRLTYEELIVKALDQQFPDGATIGELMTFIRGSYGRAIAQSSFSPVLSRMRGKGKLQKTGKVWSLDEFHGFMPNGNGALNGHAASAPETGEAATSPIENQRAPGWGPSG